MIAPPEPRLPQTPPAREFVFTDTDFERIRRLIYQKAGISLSPVKRDMVYSRLARRLRDTGGRTFAGYLDHLEQRGDEAEWQAFVNALTTNLTAFFREPHHFPILADLLRRGGGRAMRIWCCAASTGEEPYSIAMTAVETFGGFDIPVEILATDLDTSVLATAEQGIYPIERVDKLEPGRIQRYFLRGTGKNEGAVRVRPELRRLVNFARINLLDPDWPVSVPLDVIFCRNVMIYFDKPTQYKILSRFAPLLREDGLLFAGHSESFVHAADLFHSLGKTVYELARHPR